MNPIDLAELAGGALQEKSQKALQDVFENMQEQPKPVETKFALGTNLATGEVLAEEYGPGIKGQISLDEYQKEQQIDGKTVDTDTGEIIEDTKENDGVVDFRQVKQA